ALYMAHEGNPGPVHLNFPFREPLTPDFPLDFSWESDQNESYHPVYEGRRELSSSQIDQLLSKIEGKQRGLIVCGPQMDDKLAQAVTDLATAWNIPVLADPLSQLRSGLHNKETIIENYDALLKN